MYLGLNTLSISLTVTHLSFLPSGSKARLLVDKGKVSKLKFSRQLYVVYARILRGVSLPKDASKAFKIL